MRVAKMTASCPRCGASLTIYPRHVSHKEPIVCPECGRRNSADELDLEDEIARLVGDLKDALEP